MVKSKFLRNTQNSLEPYEHLTEHQLSSRMNSNRNTSIEAQNRQQHQCVTFHGNNSNHANSHQEGAPFIMKSSESKPSIILANAGTQIKSSQKQLYDRKDV